MFNNWIFRPSSNWRYLNDKGVHDSAQADTSASNLMEMQPTSREFSFKRRCGFTGENKSDDVHYSLDFVEFEQAPDPIAQEDNAINIVSKGATPNDDTDDSRALYDAIYEAKQTGRMSISQLGDLISIEKSVSMLLI